MSKLTAIILAAGESTRMRSRRPKSLHQICGRPLIHYPVSLARALGARVIVVVGRGADDVSKAVSREAEATFVEQRERRGTGHAVLQAREACGDDSDAILVLPGDMPLLSETTLRRLVERHRETNAAATLLTAQLDDPASTYVDDTVQIGADTILYPGVTLEGHTVIGAECTVGPGSCLSASRLGDRVTVRPYCVLNEVVVEDDAALGPFCHLRPGSHVGAEAKIGNFVEL